MNEELLHTGNATEAVASAQSANDDAAIKLHVSRAAVRASSLYQGMSNFVLNTKERFDAFDADGNKVQRNDLWVYPAEVYNVLRNANADEDTKYVIGIVLTLAREKRDDAVCRLLIDAELTVVRTFVAQGEIYDENREAAQRDMYITKIIGVKLGAIGARYCRTLMAALNASAVNIFA